MIKFILLELLGSTYWVAWGCVYATYIFKIMDVPDKQRYIHIVFGFD